MDDTLREKFMRQALHLAAKGAGRVAPNPQVGAVLVRDGRLIGRGYHHRFGADHAEVDALRNCRRRGHDPAGAALFVTLEPCCCQGKTPPCTDALIQAGLAAVEIAVLDPSPNVNGRGARQLREAGLDVRIGCCEHQARLLNAGFFTLQKKHRPLVILKWAQSLDAKLAWPPAAKRRWLTGEKARHHLHTVRSRCGAILVGIGTVLADDPLLNARLNQKTWQPRRIVLDSRLRIPLDSQLVRSAAQFPLEIFTLRDAIDQQWQKVDALDDCECRLHPVPPSGDGRLDLSAVLQKLTELGVADLLVEGGPTVLKSFQREHLVDQVMVYLAPALIGDPEVPALEWLPLLKTLQHVRTQTFDPDVLVEGFLAPP